MLALEHVYAAVLLANYRRREFTPTQLAAIDDEIERAHHVANSFHRANGLWNPPLAILFRAG
jgi:hypothetical protein